MKPLAAITGLLLLTGFSVANAQTADPEPKSALHRVNSTATPDRVATSRLISIKAADLRPMRAKRVQFQFLNTQRSENDHPLRPTRNTYNPILIPLW